MYEDGEMTGASVVSCGDAPEVLKLVETTLDPVSGLVGECTVGIEDFARAVGRDNGKHADLGDAVADGIAVVGPGSHEAAGLGPVKEIACFARQQVHHATTFLVR